LDFYFFSNFQILSWLCRKGEETLSRYQVTLADSLASAKSQEREFQRFLTLAQVRKLQFYFFVLLHLYNKLSPSCCCCRVSSSST
jgi:hypothetical protein